MKQKFDGKDGKVLFLRVEEVSNSYPEGTLKVEAIIYPAGSGSYSSFIYTNETIPSIENSFPKIAEMVLADGKVAYGCQEISDILSSFLEPIFPKKRI